LRTSIGRLSKLVDADAKKQGVTNSRMRRWVAATAFFQLLNNAASTGKLPGYAVKGGFAMELRLKGRARASQDIDLVLVLEGDDAVELLRRVLEAEWCEFTFQIKDVESREHVHRVALQVRYQRGNWCTLLIDLGSAIDTTTEEVEAFDLSSMGLDAADLVACLSREHQLAELIHAVTDPTENARYRNLIDIILIEDLGFDLDALRSKVEELFVARNKQQWPPNFQLPGEWESPLRAILAELQMNTTPQHAAARLTGLIARILGVTPNMNYQYRFLILSAQGRIPTLMENAIANDEAYGVFTRMTETEGWRVVTVLQYPQTQANRAILVVLEKELT